MNSYVELSAMLMLSKQIVFFTCVVPIGSEVKWRTEPQAMNQDSASHNITL